MVKEAKAEKDEMMEKIGQLEKVVSTSGLVNNSYSPIVIANVMHQ